jgi:hypothetical protein
MRSILAALAAWILRVSRILHGNGTLTHYRGLRDDDMRGHRGRPGTDDPSAPRSPAGSRAHIAHPGVHRQAGLVRGAAVHLGSVPRPRRGPICGRHQRLGAAGFTGRPPNRDVPSLQPRASLPRSAMPRFIGNPPAIGHLQSPLPILRITGVNGRQVQRGFFIFPNDPGATCAQRTTADPIVTKL